MVIIEGSSQLYFESPPSMGKSWDVNTSSCNWWWPIFLSFSWGNTCIIMLEGWQMCTWHVYVYFTSRRRSEKKASFLRSNPFWRTQSAWRTFDPLKNWNQIILEFESRMQEKTAWLEIMTSKELELSLNVKDCALTYKGRFFKSQTSTKTFDSHTELYFDET